MLLKLHRHKEWINDFTGKIGMFIYRVFMGITEPYSALDNHKSKCPKKTSENGGDWARRRKEVESYCFTLNKLFL